jgi:hypothetical protein
MTRDEKKRYSLRIAKALESRRARCNDTVTEVEIVRAYILAEESVKVLEYALTGARSAIRRFAHKDACGALFLDEIDEPRHAVPGKAPQSSDDPADGKNTHRRSDEAVRQYPGACSEAPRDLAPCSEQTAQKYINMLKNLLYGVLAED